MNYNIVLINFPEPPVENFMMLDEDFEFPEFGDLNEVKKNISKSFPNIEWIDAATGSLNLSDTTIEIKLEPTMILIESEGNDLEYIQQLCQSNKWSAYDCMAGEPL